MISTIVQASICSSTGTVLLLLSEKGFFSLIAIR